MPLKSYVCCTWRGSVVAAELTAIRFNGENQMANADSERIERK